MASVSEYDTPIVYATHGHDLACMMPVSTHEAAAIVALRTAHEKLQAKVKKHWTHSKHVFIFIISILTLSIAGFAATLVVLSSNEMQQCYRKCSDLPASPRSDREYVLCRNVETAVFRAANTTTTQAPNATTSPFRIPDGFAATLHDGGSSPLTCPGWNTVDQIYCRYLSKNSGSRGDENTRLCLRQIVP